MDDNDNDNDDDDDLQAAIALSMQQHQQQQVTAAGDSAEDNNGGVCGNGASPASMTTSADGEIKPSSNSNTNIMNIDTPPPAPPAPASAPDSTADNPTAANGDYFDIHTFQSLMWSSATTTKNDKERWIYERISTPFSQQQQQQQQQKATTNNATVADGGGSLKSPPEPAANNAAFASAASNSISNSSIDEPLPARTPLEIFTGSKTSSRHHDYNDEATASRRHRRNDAPSPQQVWGLTQKHGGPCGVLASLQAEILRILLFGRGGDDRRRGELYHPFRPNVAENYDKCEMAPIRGGEAREALAMAAGMMLARAGLMEAASLENDSSSMIDSNFSNGNDGEELAVVKLVLPQSFSSSSSAWIGEMLRSNSQSTAKVDNEEAAASASASSSGLRVYTISMPMEERTNDSHTGNAGEYSPEMKRPRNSNAKEVSFAPDNDNTTSPNDQLTEEQKKMTSLARAVANFLLTETPPDEISVGSSQMTTTSAEKEKEESTPSISNSNINNNKRCPLDFFQGPGGVMFLVMSLVETRGIDRIRADMDDSTTTITSQFGHSSQELMNLLLTGQAVSNVFDNSMNISEDLKCHGIQRRSAIGYLSALESLRYCEVGGYYKSPLFPIWVVGSTSHFSVLFGDEQCLKESKSDALLEKCRRAFKKVEGGDENGFIPVDTLNIVIDELDLRTKVGGDSGISTLQAYLETSGAGIILWDDFWKFCSRLMTGSSLESAMSSEGDSMLVDYDPIKKCGLNPVHFAEAFAPMPIQSDEELAKKLAAEWGSMPDSMATAASAASGNQKAKTDEDYARELQAQWDAEYSAAGDLVDLTSQAATTDDVATLASVSDRPPTPVPDKKMPADEGSVSLNTYLANAFDVPLEKEESHGQSVTSSGNQQQLDFEKHGLSFPLYHYNGLYGGTLTHFRLTRLSPAEAVGASIALSSKGGGSGHGTGGGGDLEDVVRTKWPSSMLNWFGKSPPSID